MMTTTVKIGTAGRGQIPHDVRRRLNISEGDTLIVEIKEIVKGVESDRILKQREVL
jgi:AbrB family looped-hinge helix DNA binding protein